MEKGKPETQEKSLGAKREQQQTHPMKHGAGIITKLINLSTDRTAFFYLAQRGTVNKPNTLSVLVHLIARFMEKLKSSF